MTRCGRGALGAAVLALAPCACRSAPEAPPAPAAPAVGDSIVVAGELVPIGAPVVLWYQPPFWSAYDLGPRFSDEGPRGLRYRPGREGFGEHPDRAALEQAIDLFVLHYDACGVSRECFRVLQDQRRLSVHFMLDVDGTLYQTMDLADTAWHARQANARSVGVEIANPGAYPPGEASALDRWYVDDGSGLRLRIPARLGDGGVRTPGFVGRPARPGRLRGEVQGTLWEQVDLTPEQYTTLAHLTAALVRTFPRLPLAFPLAPDGTVRTTRLPPDEEARFHGILGHEHVSETKRDPGPAFDWPRLHREATALLPSP